MTIRMAVIAGLAGLGITGAFVQANHPPEPLGLCCLDVSDGPIPFETCVDTEASACYAEGGIPGPPDSTCAAGQACCLSFGGDRFCFELDPFCCAISGGVAVGPPATCADLDAQGGCGVFCGGIASLPCSEGEFCRLGLGTCCCDFFGICTPLPDACPAVIDPVCGCDEATYLNACVADAAGMSIDRLGPCTATHGDVDGDGDIDSDDIAFFAVCMSPPGSPPDQPDGITEQHCLAVFDSDHDADIDLGDFAYLQILMRN